MDALQETANYLRKQLAEIETQIAIAKPPAAGMSMQEMKVIIADWNESQEWKDSILTDYGVVDNIVDILDECYYPFVDAIREDYPGTSASSVLGSFKSTEWRMFQIRVMKRLLDPLDFSDFSDTADGCDETAWNEGLAEIKASCSGA